MRLRKVSALAAAALTLSLTATACGGGDDDEGVTIGIKFDQPGLGLKTPDNDFTGFDVDVATYIAEHLGYAEGDIEWVEAPTPDREGMLQRGDVDFIVATYSISDERKQQIDFAGPYFLAHQDLLIRADEEFTGEDDINDMTLCSVEGSTSAANVRDDFAPDAELQPFKKYSECLNPLKNETIDALTTDDSILAGYAAQEQYQGEFKLAGLSLSDEYYGVGVPKGETQLRDDINEALREMVSDGSWEEFVQANFGAANYDYEPAPEITETG